MHGNINTLLFMKTTVYFPWKKKWNEWHCFIFSKTSLMSGLIKIARFSYLFLYLVCGDTVFRLKYIKKIQPHTEIGKKQRSILITFSDICRFFFLYYHTKTWQVLRCYKLIATWNLKPYNWTFLIVILKFTSLFCTFDRVIYLCVV